VQKTQKITADETFIFMQKEQDKKKKEIFFEKNISVNQEEDCGKE
jgi:hypothetical protein